MDTKQKAEYVGKDGKQSEVHVFLNDDKKTTVSINSSVLLFSRLDIKDADGNIVSMGLELKDLEGFIKKMKEGK